MNMQERDLLNELCREPFVNQRILAEKSGYSLGKVNQSLKNLQAEGCLDADMRPTARAQAFFEENKPQSAIILAAGFGMRMVPINREVPKGLLKVNGEILIERLIEQLHRAGIREITVVVGFMKEAFEYLIDRYGVDLKVNPEYAVKNNLHSLALVSDRIANSYILPSDIWCGETPFREREAYSWYMVGDIVDDDSYVRVNRKQELVRTAQGGNQMIGVSYIAGEDAAQLRERINAMNADSTYDGSFWEDALFERDKMLVGARVVSAKNTYEVNTYEQLREMDSFSPKLKSKILDLIASVLGADEEEIEAITVLKKGMTNRSFFFSCRGRQYIMRIPGEGTEKLINRREEYEVYQAIRDLQLSDEICYMDPESGYKMTVYMENARVCDAENPQDVRRCMQTLRSFHEKGLHVDHYFDVFEKIEYYESLWLRPESCYRDYRETKRKIFTLKRYIESQPKELVLSHIDSVADNFLFVPGEEGEQVRIIDWEYGSMQDPHIDIAMFGIYSLYNREQMEGLIDTYFPEGCDPAVRLKLYCYIAACGLLWSNWCEYKLQLGVEFGEYSLGQYRYAKDYYKIFQEEQEKFQHGV